MFLVYDPEFRHIVETAAVPEPAAYRAVLRGRGVPFLEIEGALPAPIDALYVDMSGDLALRRPMPGGPFDGPSHAAETLLRLEGLPDGAVVTPPLGTILRAGVTQVTVRAPGYRDATFLVSVRTADHLKAELLAHAAQRRWERETARMVWRGHVQAADDRAALKITRAAQAAARDPDWSTDWQFADGSTLRLAGSDVVDLDAALQAHHDTAFAAFARVREGIEAGAITDTAQVDAAMAATGA